MCTVTVQEVKDFTGQACAPDAVIQLYLDSINEKIGACLDAYDSATCQLITLNLVAHLTCGSEGKVTSVRAPNGASKSYQVSQTKSGLRSSKYGETVYLLDTNGCWQNYFAQSFTINTIGEEQSAQDYLNGEWNDFYDDGGSY